MVTVFRTPMTSTTEPIAGPGTCPGEACGHVPTGRATPAPGGALRRPVELQRNIDVSGLVDDEGGLLDRAVFTDQQLYRQELRRVFAPSWLFLAHTDQFHKPGDFFTTYMGEDPVIVTMTKNREIKAYLNSCRHRGARVCRADFGQTRNFTCTYHGWAYDLDGALVSVPNESGYPESFRRDDWGLVEVPHVESYHGLIFGTWNPDPISLRESLGDMAWYMDAMLDHDSEGTVVVGGVHKWVLEGNWKLAAEQFATDWYHVNMSHASALMVLSPTGRGPKDEIIHRQGRQYVDPNGHGAGFPVHPRNRFDADTVHEWMDYEALRSRLGDARVEGPLTTGHATVFPNFSYLPVNGSIRVWHPKGPDRMEVWAWTIVDRSMPDEVREAQRLYNLRTFGPSGIFEQDDGENWSECQAIAHGFITNGVALNYQMGLGSEREDGRYPGTTSELYSDAAGRSFYARWRNLMNTPAWHEEKP
jgi:3-phenylpropionate/trans-cinnamate dioxygenase alpha subunit